MDSTRIGRYSAVCVFHTVDFHNCVGCRLLPREGGFGNYRTRAPKQFRRHLKSHVAAGQKVPVGVLEQIDTEIRNAAFEAERQASPRATMRIATRVRSKWRFVDLETGDVWKWGSDWCVLDKNFAYTSRGGKSKSKRN